MERAQLSTAQGKERSPLIAARERLHFSQQEVADKLGVSKAAVHRWEKKGDIPQPYHLRQLCELYGLPARELGFVELTVDVQTITDEQRTKEPDTGALDAFRKRHTARRIETMIWNWSRRDARYHLLQSAILAELEDDNMNPDDVMSRRDVLRSLALLPIDMSGLSALSAILKNPVEEILAQCAAGVLACWYLRKGDELVFADQAVSKYIPTLKAIVQTAPSSQRKAAADLLAQSLLLKSVLAWDITNMRDAITYAQQAELYSEAAENRLLQIAVLREKAAALFYARQWKQAFQTTQEAKHLLDERDKQDKQKRPSASLYPAEEPVPHLLASHVYAGLAKYQAHEGQKEDALLSLKKAHVAFFEQTAHDMVPLWIDHHIGNLLKYEAQTYIYLDLHKSAVETLEQIHTQYAQDTTIHLTSRYSVFTEQIMAEVNRNDQPRRMDWCIDRWEKALEGAEMLQSNVQFENVVQAYTAMRAAWPGEKQIIDLRKHLAH
jgi:transcriptional regulator with XRE-family HTH domain